MTTTTDRTPPVSRLPLPLAAGVLVVAALGVAAAEAFARAVERAERLEARPDAAWSTT